eukprot:857075-Karenia_brevis.AAC.1
MSGGRVIDVTEECSICLQELYCWPSTGDLATCEMSLTQLSCGHAFHTECLNAKEISVTGQDTRLQSSEQLGSNNQNNCRSKSNE